VAPHRERRDDSLFAGDIAVADTSGHLLASVNSAADLSNFDQSYDGSLATSLFSNVDPDKLLSKFEAEGEKQARANMAKRPTTRKSIPSEPPALSISHGPHTTSTHHTASARRASKQVSMAPPATKVPTGQAANPTAKAVAPAAGAPAIDKTAAEKSHGATARHMSTSQQGSGSGKVDKLRTLVIPLVGSAKRAAVISKVVSQKPNLKPLSTGGSKPGKVKSLSTMGVWFSHKSDKSGSHAVRRSSNSKSNAPIAASPHTQELALEDANMYNFWVNGKPIDSSKARAAYALEEAAHKERREKV